MAKNNDFSIVSKNVVVSASIGSDLYDRARTLQEKGFAQANWSNAMRRGLMLVCDIGEGKAKDTDESIKRLVTTIQEQNKLIDELKQRGV